MIVRHLLNFRIPNPPKLKLSKTGAFRMTDWVSCLNGGNLLNIIKNVKNSAGGRKVG